MSCGFLFKGLKKFGILHLSLYTFQCSGNARPVNDFANRSLVLHFGQVRNDLQNRFTLKSVNHFQPDMKDAKNCTSFFESS